MTRRPFRRRIRHCSGGHFRAVFDQRYKIMAKTKAARSVRPQSRRAARPQREKRRLWLTFSAEATTKPILWKMSRRFDLVFNVRNSSVTNEVGLIALELEGAPRTIESAVRWFRTQGVQVDPVELNAIEG